MFRFIMMYAALLLLATSCASNKTVLPTAQQPSTYRVPAQQQVLSEAVSGAVAKIDASAYAGKRIYVEVIGVMPHANNELLDYVADSVRSHLGVNGAQVVFPVGDTEKNPVDLSAVDYVVVAAVEMGGADKQLQNEILGFSSETSLVGKARIRVTGYPTKGGPAVTSTGQAQATRQVSAKTFWFFPLSTYYGSRNFWLF